MSVASTHREWLNLIDVSGPFLSPPVLTRAFPQGLDAHEPEIARQLREAYADWLENRHTPAVHRGFIDFVLQKVLELPPEALISGPSLPPSVAVRVAEQGETLRPDLALVDPTGTRTPRLLIQILSPDQDLEGPLSGSRWKASPATRIAALCRGAGVRLGLVTNGERWMLVDAKPHQTTGYASFYASLFLEEPLTLRAFRSLLCARRFFGVAAKETLEGLLDQSAQDQAEVTEKLGRQVREATGIFLAALDRIDQERGGALLRGISEREVYEAALTVMMRLVFLLAAEERGLLRLGDDVYDRFYAASTLRAQLREVADRQGEEILERRSSGWVRLCATWRAVHGGIAHEALRLPAYGGGLFDPDRFPFLEGRPPGSKWHDTPASPPAFSDRTLLQILDCLQLLQEKTKGGGREARRLSFRALDIEQIGHVYEGLLDHAAVRAQVPVLGLRSAADRDGWAALDRLEAERSSGEPKLVSYVHETTGRSEAGIQKDLEYDLPDEHSHWLSACENDASLLQRVRPFAGLVREDAAEYPVIVRQGGIYLAPGEDRRSSGTHYTPRSLTEPLVQHTLDPLVFDGPADGRLAEKWTLRSPREILGLRVCDMAAGSGAFLVQACRYLAERLVEAWERAERASPGRVVVTPEGDLSQGLPTERPLPRNAEERMALARRLAADRCLFGVDKNPMAVEMAKLSLWLVTLQKDRPFTFLDHAVRSGDSLLGVTSAAQLEYFHLDPARGRSLHASLFNYTAACVPAVRQAIELRRKLESFPVNDQKDAEEKAQLLSEARAASEGVFLLADLLVGAALETAGRPRDYDDLLVELAAPLGRALNPAATAQEREQLQEPLRRRAQELLASHRPFHWALEFPEVFLEGGRGFDAIVGNPPFLGGQKITGALGTAYRDLLVEGVGRNQRGSADLCAYFFLRAEGLLRKGGGFGLIATNTIAQGDTREVGLEQLAASGLEIVRAVPSRPWPGGANLEVAHVWGHKGGWQGGRLLDEREVSGITPFLVIPGKVVGKPYRLAANAGKSFQGSIVLGMGFVLAPEEAARLIERNSKNRDVVFPYLNGEDLNSRPDQSASRWVINFRDWPLDRETAPEGYDGPVAADYQDCLAILLEKVKPEREQNNRKVYRERWWHYAEKRPELYAALVGAEQVLACSEVTKHLGFLRVPNGIVFSANLDVFLIDPSRASCLHSAIHEVWAQKYSSTLETRLKYSPGNAFETFAFPEPCLEGLASIGEHLHSQRQVSMLGRREGLTQTYNRFHDSGEHSEDIVQLRRVHAEMDRAIASAYGWADLDLGHGFHETKQGLRFALGPEARTELLDRLLALNHERYQQEVTQGLHEVRPKSKGKRAASAGPGQGSLF